ncbi:MAG: glycoside hydrolase family 2 [Ignavibacteriales bacterium]|nr:MAG: glycoside hydrolase family 2 [Ignavibacteriales bacterium]
MGGFDFKKQFAKYNSKRGIQMKTLIKFLMLIIAAVVPAQTNNYSFWLKDNWFIQSSEVVKVNGEKISLPDFKFEKASDTNKADGNWYPVNLPSTVLAGLVNNKVYENIYYSDNLKMISDEKLKKSWWYRTEFEIPNQQQKKTVKLEFDGINYKANIWLNGKLIADTSIVFGAYRQFEFNISAFVKTDNMNVLAVEVFPPVAGDYTIGFVDWNPTPPDKNMGLFRGVKIKQCGDVSINCPFVESSLQIPGFKTAALKISAEIQNNNSRKISGILEGRIESILFAKNVVLEPNETKTIVFNANEFVQLNIYNPRVWWTHDLGKQELYDLVLTFKTDNYISDSQSVRFGIREVTDYFNEYGYRGYKLNGKKIVVCGGGWVDNMMLDNSYENLQTQVAYARHMNLNALRLEGFWGNSEDLYNLCDERGILLMVGWSCQWEWEAFIGKKHDDYGAVTTGKDFNLLSQSWRDQIKWLRNHPSIFVWLYGSDKFPNPTLEKDYLKTLSLFDSTRCSLASAGNKTSLAGKTGVKMTGPYDYIPPAYWYIDSLNGGAFGFNSETGPGVQLPVLESIKKFIRAEHLWPVDSVWNFHCGGLEFKNLNCFTEALNNRLGSAKGFHEYNTKAQFLNYENSRAMFEAFIVNKYKSTGVIQWMYNAAWPKIWWQLYDYYLIPNAAFYGVRKACEPVHLIYNYGNKYVSVVNNTLNQFSKLNAEIKVFNFNLAEKYSVNKTFDLWQDEVKSLLSLSEIEGLTNTYFLSLELFNEKDELISSNFYTLSASVDTPDFEKTEWFVTPTKEYADLTDLNKLTRVSINKKYSLDKTKQGTTITALIENPAPNLAFQIELKIAKKDAIDNILPVMWNDNYFSLLPGQKKTVIGLIPEIAGDVNNIDLIVSGWNIE